MTPSRPLSAGVDPFGGEVHTRADAQARAEADLDAVRLPPRAVRASTAPSPHLTGPPQTHTGDTIVDASRWYTVQRSTTADVLAAVKAHPPVDLDLTASSSGGSDGVASVSYLSADSGNNEVDVSVVQDGTTASVRVDAQVTWLPPEAAADTIAADVTAVRLTYHGGFQQPGQPKPIDRTVTVTGGALDRLVRAINGLELVPPDQTWSCPMDTGERATVSVPGHGVSFAIDMTGCRFVTVSSDGQQGDLLRDTTYTGIQQLVHSLVGVTPSPSNAPKAAK